MTTRSRVPLAHQLVALAAFTSRQFGVFTLEQAATVDVSRQQVHAMRQGGLVVPRYRGVYALVTVTADWFQAAMAGLLAAGPDAALSGRAAAKLHGLTHLGVTTRFPDLQWSVPRDGRIRRSGPPVVTEVHLGAADVVRSGPWRLTSVAWTIFTLAYTLGVERTERALDAAIAAGRTTSTLAGATAVRFRHCTGMPVIREVLQRHDPRVRLTRSEAERLLLRILRDAGLPLPEIDVRVLDAYGQRRYLDFAYEDLLIFIEVDVHPEHGRTIGRHHDGHRQNGLVPPWTPVRFDELDLVYAPDRVVADVRRALVAAGVTLD